MLDKMKDAAQQLQMMQKMMKDENFRAFIANPKVQELFRDPEFKSLVQGKDYAKMAAYPKFAALMQDPELASVMTKIDVKGFLNG